MTELTMLLFEIKKVDEIDDIFGFVFAVQKAEMVHKAEIMNTDWKQEIGLMPDYQKA